MISLKRARQGYRQFHDQFSTQRCGSNIEIENNGKSAKKIYSSQGNTVTGEKEYSAKNGERVAIGFRIVKYPKNFSCFVGLVNVEAD